MSERVEWAEVVRHGRFSYAVTSKSDGWIVMEHGRWMFRRGAERYARKLVRPAVERELPVAVLHLDSPDYLAAKKALKSANEGDGS